ncbi:hypothetical protein K080096A4_34800 [[Clostridium] innocuum]
MNRTVFILVLRMGEKNQGKQQCFISIVLSTRDRNIVSNLENILNIKHLKRHDSNIALT